MVSVFDLLTLSFFTVLYLLVAFTYFLPSIIAVHKKHRSTLAVILVNTFLGWTVFGWIFALIWSRDPDMRKKEFEEEDDDEERNHLV